MSLPVMCIHAAREEWEKLKTDVWSDQYIHAFLIEDGIQEPVKIRYRGGHTRAYPKKSYEVQRKTGALHLNAEYDDPSMIRNALSFQFFEWIGVPSPAARHCLLHINGEDHGVYLCIEGVDPFFFQRRGRVCQALMYAGNDDANFGLLNLDTRKLKKSLLDGYEVIIGDASHRKGLEDFIWNINTQRGINLVKTLESRLDIENYLRWIAGAVFTGNYDGFKQNYAIYQADTVYRMIPWDYEGTWGRNCFGERCANNTVRILGYNTLTRRIMAFQSYRQRYKKILNEIIKTSFTVRRIRTETERLMENLRIPMELDSTRRHRFTVFERELEVITTYVRHRRNYLSKAMNSL